MAVTWVLEHEAFLEGYDLPRAVESHGCQAVRWDDSWVPSDSPVQALANGPVVFHGSLGAAYKVASSFAWAPGAFCDEVAFRCSEWYPRANEWLLHERREFSTVSDFVENPAGVAGHLADPTGQVFVRPNSPLKPFSGRVCTLSEVTLTGLDFGFYYDDPGTEVVVAPVRAVGREWRFVVVDDQLVAASGYDADRIRSAEPIPGAVTKFAQTVVAGMEAPEVVYVLDVCESDGVLRLLELNPFSGASLYGCDCDDVVVAVSRLAGSGGAA